MSRTQQQVSLGIPNPSKKWFQWSSANKCISYFDKNLGEKGEDVLVPLPFTFLVLDELSKVGGWHDPSEAYLRSNEVKNISKDPFIVRLKGVIIAEGLYKDIKPLIEAKDGEYCKSVYVAYKEANGSLEIGNLFIRGAAMGAWIEFCDIIAKETKGNKFDPWFTYKGAVQVSGYTDEKKGATKYTKPIFKQQAVKEETMQEADALDVVLQEYFNQKTVEDEKEEKPNPSVASEKHEPSDSDVPNGIVAANDDLSDLPF